MAIDKQTMMDLIIEAKRTGPETGSFAEWLAEYLVAHLPSLTPPNEPLTEGQLMKMIGSPIWIESARRAGWMLLWGYNGPEVYGRAFIFTRRTGQKESFPFSELGVTWRAYRFQPDRRPPEGDART